MPVAIIVGGARYEWDSGQQQWTSSVEPEFAKLLTKESVGYFKFDLPSAALPDKNERVARDIIKKYGGEIIEFDEPIPFDSDTVY